MLFPNKYTEEKFLVFLSHCLGEIELLFFFYRIAFVSFADFFSLFVFLESSKDMEHVCLVVAVLNLTLWTVLC